MKFISLLGLAASVSAQAVTSLISPPGSNPAGSVSTYNGYFEITVINTTMTYVPAFPPATNCGQTGILTLNLTNGMIKDITGRFGYIASNYQFQLDPPPGPQAGAIYTDGFSIFSNGSLAIGPNATFYECYTDPFFNLYSQPIGGQCTPVFIYIIPCSGNAPATTSAASAASTVSGATSMTAPPVSEFSDGQPQVVSEYSDGQPQVPQITPAPVSEFSDGQPQVVSTVIPAPVSEFSDGQPQVTSTLAPKIVPGAGNMVSGQGVLALAGFLAAAIF